MSNNRIACSVLTAKTVTEMQLQLPLTFSFSLDSVSIVKITYFDTFNPCLKQNKQNPSVLKALKIIKPSSLGKD